MSSRRYPVAELYDERQRDFYRNGRRSDRSYDELDIQLRESHRDFDPRRSQPDFLREDYGKTTAGPLVMRDRERVKDDFQDRASSRGGSRRDRDVEKEEIIIRDSHGRRDSASVRAPPPPRERDVDRDEFVYRREERGPRGPPPPREVEREEIIIRRREDDDDVRSVKSHATRATGRSRARTMDRGGDIDQEEIIIRRSETEGPPRPPPSSRGPPPEREDISFRRVQRGPPPAPAPPPPREVDQDEIIFRHEEREGRGRDYHRDELIIRDTSRGPTERSRPPPREPSRGPGGRDSETIVIRGGRERSLPPPRLVKREEEDFVLRRRQERPPSPCSPPREEKQEIIIRRTERERTPSPVCEPPPPPPPEPEPIIRPPIVQEIITHHRHIDHGVERACPPSPPPPPPSPPKEENLEISINRRSASRGRETSEEIIIRDRRDASSSPSPSPPPMSRRGREDDMPLTRPRSEGNVRRRYDYDDDISSEADFYNRKALERGYNGEAYNGATRDWGLVDVPPGTRKVRMDGMGGAAQEITWQQYNGNRKSKFVTEDGEYPSDYGRGSQRSIAPAPPPAPAPAAVKDDMWTEITKDLVLEEAIQKMGYEYEENDKFFYVQEYLRYEDVLKLVELSDDIRRDRSRRIREIEWEREEIRSKAPSKTSSKANNYDERVYEREIIYDRQGRRYR